MAAPSAEIPPALATLAKEKEIDDQVTAKIADLISKGLLTVEDITDDVCKSIKYQKPEDVLEALLVFEKADRTFVKDPSSFLRGYIKSVRCEKNFDIRDMGKKVLSGVLDRNVFIDRYCAHFDKVVESTALQRIIRPTKESTPRPSRGSEVFVGYLPRHFNELDLMPHLVKCGVVFDLHLMWDSDLEQNMGFCHVTFSSPDAAKKAVEELNGFSVTNRNALLVTITVPNTRLFLAGIPRDKDRNDVMKELEPKLEGLKEVIMQEDIIGRKKNRGFALLVFRSMVQATAANKMLSDGNVKPFDCDVVVQWGESRYELEDDSHLKGKVLFLKFLDKTLTEEQLTEAFKSYGKFEKIKLISNYAFLTFETKEVAAKALEEMQGKEVEGVTLDIGFGRPPIEVRNAGANIPSSSSTRGRGAATPRRPVGGGPMRGGFRGTGRGTPVGQRYNPYGNTRPMGYGDSGYYGSPVPTRGMPRAPLQYY